MLRLGAVAFLAVALSASAFAQAATDYWYIGMSGAGDEGNTVTLIDANRIQITGSTTRAWVEGYFEGAAASRGIRHMRNLNEYDCTGRRERNLQLTAYFSDPTRAPFTSHGDMQWQYVVPGTAGEWTFDFVCGSRNANMYVELRDGLSSAEAAEMLFELARQPRQQR